MPRPFFAAAGGRIGAAIGRPEKKRTTAAGAPGRLISRASAPGIRYLISMGTSDGLRVDIRSDTGAVPANGGNMSTTDESREGIGGNSRPAPEGARDFLTPREVASRVGVSYHSILRAIRRGELAAFLVVGRLRIET